MINDSVALVPGVTLRPATLADAPGLHRAYLRNRDHLRPWDPRRGEDFFTLAGQVARLTDQLQQRAAGRLALWVLLDDSEVVGTVTLTNIAHGPLRSANLGYWIDTGQVGRGLATAAALAACRAADERLGLHRLEAGAMVANVGSQRVLANCGFELIGTARNYLHIDGEWRDHVLFQRILNDRQPS
ncbi:N-acetyltransferase GCN5 [Longispora fulva]|uniref:Ribosomal-protein-alanine N-acetyltransferase n=1 Tax=Longispora fulva TaxID=619741 RepID=A0A8J7GJB7_9ACTN|nr:GNAT family protein [Longispora fulva]MBG6137690.1 ribosomal-protein-alanine N-acetyltransferase [Longispora fulva]GIG62153.1 N-acetyltransferase GCN5 [Longispora fulva]